MFGKRHPRRVGHADKIAFAARLVDLAHDGAPHQPVRWVGRRAGFALNAHHGAHTRIHRRAVAAQQDDGGRAVAGDVGAAGVHHMGQVQPGQHLLNQLRPKLALHKAVGGNQPDKARALPTGARHSQVKEPLGERCAQRILHVAAGVFLAVGGIQRRVFHDDVGRVAHHGVVLAAQNALHLGQVFADVGVGQAGVGVGLGGVKQVLALRQAKAGAVQQAVANGYGNLKVVRIGQALHAAGLQGGHQQPKARNGHGKGVQVHAGHGVQRLLR